MGLCPWSLPPSPCCSICRAERQRPDQKPPDSSVECEVCNTPTKNFLGPCHQYLSNSRAALSCRERLGAGTHIFSHLRRVWLGGVQHCPLSSVLGNSSRSCRSSNEQPGPKEGNFKFCSPALACQGSGFPALSEVM